jgi:hypothetical protein
MGHNEHRERHEAAQQYADHGCQAVTGRAGSADLGDYA